MQCLRCKTENKALATHCVKCGAPLRLRRSGDRYGKQKTVIILVIIMGWVVGLSYTFHKVIFPSGADNKQTLSSSVKERTAAEKRLNGLKLKPERRAALESQEKAAAAEKAAPAVLKKTAVNDQAVITGWLSVADPWGHQVSKVRGAVTGAGWLALPLRACIGGKKWLFTTDSGKQYIVNSGRWRAGNAVGLWHVGLKTPLSGPELRAWNSSLPVDWFWLTGAGVRRNIKLTSGKPAGDFMICSFVNKRKPEAGIFVQNGYIVGWSFGPWLNNIYMWAGEAGQSLSNNSTVDDVYNQTFAGGREEQFARAYAQQGNSGIKQLAAFAAAWQAAPNLSLADTPDYLRPTEITKLMRRLSQRAIKAGDGAEVVRILNSDTLRRAADINLLMDIVPAVTAVSGFEAATSLIEDTGRDIVQAGGHNVPALNIMHAGLYREWLRSLLTVRALKEGMTVWRKASDFYPKDPSLHLLGVELLLAAGNWQEAETLLLSREYPAALQDKVDLLGRRISDMKGEAGKIVVHFQPGSATIPVTAMLNAVMNQKFMVDTGASMVTIPSDTADALGLKIISDYHGGSQDVSTAGGMVSATRVMIDTLEINGWVEHDIPALVMDIPGQPGVGLLGLNYLKRFKMNLNNEQGSLLLTPR
ncbi:retropepsin-like aspartic protease family protein [Desulfobacterota bacterium M19]